MAYYIDKNSCTTCGYCADVCVNGAIIKLPDTFEINPLWCNECGSCEAMCYDQAIFYEGLSIKVHENKENFDELILYYQEQEMEDFALI